MNCHTAFTLLNQLFVPLILNLLNISALRDGGAEARLRLSATIRESVTSSASQTPASLQDAVEGGRN